MQEEQPCSLEDSPVIELTDDPILIARLGLKLEEYKLRLIEHRNPFQAPEGSDTHYKIFVLQKVLTERRVLTWELSREYEATYLCFDPRLFEIACGVVEDYIKTGGKRTLYGSGLPPLPSKP
jgi:hypothetical protein